MTAPETSTRADLVRGQPRFLDDDVAATARLAGDAAAWRVLVQRHGARAPEHVHGAFAVALALEGGRSFLAVDRFGAATLCWRQDAQGTLHWAERADTLADAAAAAEGRQGDDALDPQALYDYLYFHAIPAPRTVFRGVMRLPAAHGLWHERGPAEPRAWWVPRFTSPATGDFEALKAEFRTLLARGVERQLRGGRLACYLSGGTDSSTVAGLIAQVTGTPPHSYSIGFEAEGYDEMAYARLASKRFGTTHHEYYVTPDDLVRWIPSVAQAYDQPFGNSSALPAFCCARVAFDDGVRHILAGDGGDELFGGNARYAKQRLFAYYGQVPGVLRRGLLEPLLLHTPLGRLPGLKKGASYIEQARVPLPARLQMYNLLLRLDPAQVLTPEFRDRVSQGAVLQHQQAVWDAPQASTELDRQLAYDWRYTLADSDLPKVVGTAALAGLTVGFPMLDEDLADFSMRLPESFKLRGQALRWFFKEALRGFLPDEIITKTKHGFGLPFGVWATRHEGLKALAEDSLRSLAQRGIVQPGFIDTLLRTHLPAHPGYYGEMVWVLMMMEQWMRRRRG